MKLLATISWEDIGKGLLTIAGLLVGLGVALAVFQANIGGAVAMLIASAAMIAMAGAINLLVPAMTALGQLSLEQIGKALLALGGAFLVLGGAAAVISLAAAPTFAFAMAMLALSLAAYLGAKAIETLVNALSPIMPAMLEAGANLVNGFVDGITQFRTMVVEKAVELGKAFLDGIKNFLGIHSPSTVMSEIGTNTVQGMIDGIGSLIGNLASKAGELASSVITGIGDLAGKVKDKAVNGGQAFVNGVGGFIGKVKQKGSELASNLVGGVKNVDSDLKNKGSKASSSFTSGLGAGVGKVKSKSKELLTSTITTLNQLSQKMKESATKGVAGFVSGLSSKMSAVKSAAKSITTAASSAIGSLYNKFRSVGQNAVQGFVNGITSVLSSARAAAAKLAAVASKVVQDKLKIKSPSRVFMGIGGYVGEGFAIGMAKSEHDVYKSGESLAETVPDAFANTLSAMSVNIDDLLNTDYNPVITPVINPADFDSGLSRLSSAFSTNLNGLSIGNLNYTGQLSAKIDDYNDLNRQMVDLMSNNVLDYDKLGVSVANALIQSGVHVEMDGGELVGYLAGEIRSTRRMFG